MERYVCVYIDPDNAEVRPDGDEVLLLQIGQKVFVPWVKGLTAEESLRQWVKALPAEWVDKEAKKNGTR